MIHIVFVPLKYPLGNVKVDVTKFHPLLPKEDPFYFSLQFLVRLEGDLGQDFLFVTVNRKN